jgi:hypothetical protein
LPWSATYAAIQAQSFHTPGYNETDAIANGFALAYASRDATDTRSELGARFDRVLALYPNAVLALRGRVAWAHDWVSDPSLAPVFQTLPGASFIVNGAGARAAACQRRHAARQVRRRIRLALVNLRRHRHDPLQVVAGKAISRDKLDEAGRIVKQASQPQAKFDRRRLRTQNLIKARGSNGT